MAVDLRLKCRVILYGTLTIIRNLLPNDVIETKLSVEMAASKIRIFSIVDFSLSYAGTCFRLFCGCGRIFNFAD